MLAGEGMVHRDLARIRIYVSRTVVFGWVEVRQNCTI